MGRRGGIEIAANQQEKVIFSPCVWNSVAHTPSAVAPVVGHAPTLSFSVETHYLLRLLLEYYDVNGLYTDSILSS